MLLATVLSSFAFSATLPQEPTRVMRTVPIRNIVGAETVIHHAPFGSMLNVSEDFVDLVNCDLSERRVSADFVLEFMRQAVERVYPDESQELVSAVVRSRLALSGPKQVVDRAVAISRVLEATVAAPIVVEARLFALPDREDLSTVLSPKDVEHWFKPLDFTRWESRSVTRSGHTTVLAQERHRQYLRDCDVEVAQDQSISDPIIATLFEGVHLKVEPHALPASEDLVLYCDVALGELMDEIEARSTGVTGMAALDVPRIGNNHASFSGRIENGGALVVTFSGSADAGSRYALAVSARRESERRQDPHLSAWPISALTSWSLTTGVRVSDMRYNTDDHSIFPLHDVEVEGALDTDTVLEMLYHVLEPAVDNDEVFVQSSGGWVFVIGEQAARDTALEALTTMHDQWVRSAECEVVSRVKEIRPGQPDEWAGTLHRVRLPVIMGRPHFVLRGIESTNLQDVQVEIAQEASAADPIVVSTFAGVFASIRVFDSIDGVAASASIELTHAGHAQRRAAETRHGGDLFLANTARSRFVHNGAVRSGQSIELGDAGIVDDGAKQYRIRQSLKVGVR